jgi:hypothetical protein
MGFPFSEISRLPALPTSTVIFRDASNSRVFWPSSVPEYARVPSDLIDTHTGSAAVNATRIAETSFGMLTAAGTGVLGCGAGGSGGRIAPDSDTSAGRKSCFGLSTGFTAKSGFGLGAAAITWGAGGLRRVFCHKL